ncbi:MAG TPA: M42 family metallopeptidase [Anaerolineae bacterium]|nr:M42 family metallopeptidase [Anaerolineae bacterium]
MTDFLAHLLKIPSPTGYTEEAVNYVQEVMGSNLRLDTRLNNKGALVAGWKGKASNRPRAMTAHVDTLGAMVKDIDVSTGRLLLTRIGGVSWTSVETEGCTLITSTGKKFRGSLMPRRASVHIHGYDGIEDQKRTDENVWLRLDARTTSADETQALGVAVGDFVAFDPRVEMTDTGFIRSRHLDDKAGIACIVGAVKALLDAGLQPSQRMTILISNYEEVGHGAATGIPPDVKELLTVDMAAVGAGQNSDEFSVGICVKDSGGPYHIEMRRKLVALAENAGIPYKLDIYPYYGSDGEAAWRAGADMTVGLIGPGVEASHSYERTHKDSLVATAQLIAEFMLS